MVRPRGKWSGSGESGWPLIGEHVLLGYVWWGGGDSRHTSVGVGLVYTAEGFVQSMFYSDCSKGSAIVTSILVVEWVRFDIITRILILILLLWIDAQIAVSLSYSS